METLSAAMAALPAPVHQTAAAIYALHEQREAGEQARPYLGASALGDPCARRLWMGFRWIAREQFEGRMVRLFETGHREEARVLDELRAIGLEVWDRQPDGRQFAVVETSRFFRQELYSGGWTPELRDGGALTTTSGLPVNFDDVSGEYTVLTTPPTVCRRR